MSTRYKILFVLLLALLVPRIGFAVEIVKSPIVDEGLLELEQKGKYLLDQNPSHDDEKEFEFSTGYGVTSYWKTKLDLIYKQKRASTFHEGTTRWENVINLNGNDAQKDLLLGLYADLNIGDPTDTSDGVTAGLLAQHSFGKFGNIWNAYVRRDVGVTAQKGVSLQYRWQSKYTILPYVEPGFELIGDTLHRDAFNDQTLMIGPSMFGRIALTDNTGFNYELGYLIGTTPATRDGTLKWKLKYTYQL